MIMKCDRNRIEAILKKLCEGLVEKEEAIRLAFLAAVAGESIFFLGLPGTAKSMVSRRLKNAFKGKDGKPLRYFEYLMNQFSTPDEIFGPVSLKSLENDEYKRIVKGYLPDAEVAFLDEIWKASPAIQNTLLTIINEKKFHNGNNPIDVPLKALISASNELPAENQGLEALWDRFLIRLMVNPVQDRKAFVDLVCGKPVQAEIDTSENAISIDKLEEWKKEINEIAIPDEVQNVIDAIHAKMWQLHDENPEKNVYYISDRRWMKIVHLLKTSAFLNGRSEVDLMDCALISNCIWNTNELIETLKKNVETLIIDDGHNFNVTVEEIIAQIKDYNAFVEESFFEKHPKQYQMKDGTLAYKILNPQEIESCEKCVPYYISSDYEHNSRTQRTGAYFDDKEELIGDYDYFISDDSFKIEYDTITWIDGCSENEYSVKIEMDLEKSKKLYGYYEQKPKMYKMNDDNKPLAYKIIKPITIQSRTNITPHYISLDFEHDNRQGAYFDEEKERIGSNYYYSQYYFIQPNSSQIEGDTISWIDGYRGGNSYYAEKNSVKIEMTSAKYIKGDEETLLKLKEKASNKYIEINNILVSEFKIISDYIKNKTEQYNSNLFVDSTVSEIIISDAKRAKNALDEAAIELNKIRFKYENLKSDE